MIRVFDSRETNFTGNGLGIVLPTKCEVAETLNGEYELEMEHPINDERWKRLRPGNIILAPVPAAPTPGINLVNMAEAGQEMVEYTLSGWRARDGHNPIGDYYNGFGAIATATGAAVTGTVTDVTVYFPHLKTTGACGLYMHIGGETRSVNLVSGK